MKIKEGKYKNQNVQTIDKDALTATHKAVCDALGIDYLTTLSVEVNATYVVVNKVAELGDPLSKGTYVSDNGIWCERIKYELEDDNNGRNNPN